MLKRLRMVSAVMAFLALLLGGFAATTASAEEAQTVVLVSNPDTVVGPVFNATGFTLDEELNNLHGHFVADNHIDCTFTGNFDPNNVPEVHCIATVTAINGSYQLETTFFLFTPQTYTATYVEGSGTGAYAVHHPVSAVVEDRAPGDETYTLQF